MREAQRVAAITSFCGWTGGFSPWAASEAAQGEKPYFIMDSRAFSLVATLLDGYAPDRAEKANSYQLVCDQRKEATMSENKDLKKEVEFNKDNLESVISEITHLAEMARTWGGLSLGVSMKRCVLIPSAIAGSIYFLTFFMVCHAASQEASLMLEYKLQEGDVLEYNVQMSWSFQKDQTNDRLTIGGTETLIFSQVSEEGVLTMANLASGVKMLKRNRSGEDYVNGRLKRYQKDMMADEEIAKAPPWNPFFGKHRIFKGYEYRFSNTSRYPGLGSSITQIRRNGQVVGPSPLFGQTFYRHSSIHRLIGEYSQNFPGISAQPWIQFPDTPIKVGETWTQKGRSERDISIQYTLLGFKEVNGYHCAEIQFEQSGSQLIRGEPFQMHGSLLFAVEEGFLLKEEFIVKRSEIGETESLTSELTRRKKLSHHELQQVQQELEKAQLEIARAIAKMHQDSHSSIPREAPSEEAPTAEALVGQPAPNFHLSDLSGNQVNLSDYSGKVILLNFWVPWVPSCAQQILHFINLHSRYEGQGFSMIGITFESEAIHAVGLVESFVRKNQIRYPLLIGDENLYQAYRIQAFPTTFAIGRDGKVKRVYMGYRGKAMLEAEIKALLSDEPLPNYIIAPPHRRPSESERPDIGIALGTVSVTPTDLPSTGGAVTITVRKRKRNGDREMKIVDANQRVQAVITKPDGTKELVDLPSKSGVPKSYEGTYIVSENSTNDTQTYWIGIRVTNVTSRSKASVGVSKRASFKVASQKN